MLLQRQPNAAFPADPDAADFQDGLKMSISSGRPLPANVYHYFESKISHPLHHVRIIDNHHSAALARSIGARAFTLGRHIWFGQNEFQPSSPEGQRLIAHELAHTVQQRHHREQSIPQGNPAIGRPSDPAEAEADRFAAAVLTEGQPPEIRQRAPLLRRETRPACSVSTAAQPNQRNVVCGNQTFRATWDITTTRESETRTDVDPGIDFNNIWLDIEICRGGTVVTVTPSIDLPDAFRGVLRNVLGGSSALEGVTLSPQLEIEIARSERFGLSLRGGPTFDPLQGEVTGGRGGLSLDTRIGRFGLGVEGRRGGEVRGLLTFEFGNRTPERRDCSRRRRRLRLTCERIRVIPAVDPTPPTYANRRAEVYLLFPYAKSTPIRQILLRSGEQRPRSATVDEISALGSQGYNIDRIEGFASPEGPREPSQRRRFMGNQRLSQARAETARQWISQNCPVCEGLDTTPVGRSELFSPGTTPEAEGPTLAEFATGSFLASDDPLSIESEAERRSLARGSLEARRDSIYPLLRRAVIGFSRRVQIRPAQPGSPRREIPEAVACPRAVRDAMRRHFRL